MKTKYIAKLSNGKVQTRNSTNPDLKWFGYAIKQQFRKPHQTLEYLENCNYSVAMRATPDGLLFPRPLEIETN